MRCLRLIRAVVAAAIAGVAVVVGTHAPVADAAPTPAAPTDLVVTHFGGGGVTLSWTDNSSVETGFQVERMGPGYRFVPVARPPADTTSITDKLLFPTTNYIYRVRAFNADGSSAHSNEVRIGDFYPPAPVVPAPTDLRAEVIEGGKVRLSWTDPNADELGFTLERADGGLAFRRVLVTQPDVIEYVDETPGPGWPRSYRVNTFSLRGPSAFSNVATATVPATLDLTAEDGGVLNARTEGHGHVVIRVRHEALADAESAPFDPVADGLELCAGFATSPVAVSIPKGAHWRMKWSNPGDGQTATPISANWRSSWRDRPRASVTVDFVHRTVKAAVYDVAFEKWKGRTAPAVMLLASGASGGAYFGEWRRRRKHPESFKLRLR